MFRKSPKNLFILRLLIIVAFSGNIQAFGQSPEYKNYSVKDGLPSSEIYNSMQDSKGFMWFATDKGVCRFNGYEFKTYTTINGLADNTVFECQEDYKGRIWFRSFSGKLSYFYNDSIYQLPVNDTLSKLIKVSLVTSIAIDTTETVYMGIYCFHYGVIKIDLKRNLVSVIALPPNISYMITTSNKKIIS